MEWEKSRSQEGREQFALTNLSALAVGLVHEIRNPLNTLYLQLQMLEWKLSGITLQEREELLGIVGEIRKEIKRLDEFLSEFLRFAKPPELRTVPKNIVEIIESVLGFVEVELALKNIELEKIFPEHEIIVDVDEMQFKQAIYNLILNAIQAMEGGGKLKVSVEQDGDEVRINIMDTGCGIKEEDKPKLFTLFFSTKKDGTGLGLPMVKRIVEGHDGRISIESREGEGTTVTLTFPVSRIMQITH